MSSWKPKTKREAINAAKHKICDFEELALRGMARWNMSDVQRDHVDAIVGNGAITAQPMLSDFPARQHASLALIKMMRRDRKKDGGNPKRRYYFLTFIDDMGNTSDRKPEVNIDALKRKVDKAIRSIGLNAFVAIEVQAMLNYPQHGHGRTLMFHAHAIGWTDKPFNHRKAAKSLNRKRSWNNAFGAKPVKVSPMTDRKGEIEWLSHYCPSSEHLAQSRARISGGLASSGFLS